MTYLARCHPLPFPARNAANLHICLSRSQTSTSKTQPARCMGRDAFESRNQDGTLSVPGPAARVLRPTEFGWCFILLMFLHKTQRMHAAASGLRPLEGVFSESCCCNALTSHLQRRCWGDFLAGINFSRNRAHDSLLLSVRRKTKIEIESHNVKPRRATFRRHAR